MAALEVWGRRGRDAVVTLSETVYTVGADPDAVDIVVDDPTVSQVHVILERVGPTWLVRDLGTTNGTKLGGERLLAQRRLRDRDEVLIGRTRLVFLDAASARRPGTDVLEPPPPGITPAERRVLIELCRPLLSHNAFTPPATVREIAALLFVSQGAVKAHLTNLYDKFGIADEPGLNRRVELANHALERGVVTLGDLVERGPSDRSDPA